MRLTRIEIGNFKGIGNRQSIELQPLTLLFGANSAGKSTILHALHYLRAILERGNIDPDVTIAGGPIDFGGFATLVHNHEIDRAITLKVTMALSNEQRAEQLPLNTGHSIDEPDFAELPLRYLVGENAEYKYYAIVQEIGVAIDIRWSELERSAYAARLAIDLDGERLAVIVSPPQRGRAHLTGFNFTHSLLRRAVLPDTELEKGVNEQAVSSPLEEEIRALAREAAIDRSTGSIAADQLRISVATKIGALPALDRDLDLAIRDPNTKRVALEERTPRANGLRSLLSEMMLGPTRLVRDYLAQMTYIGPLREIPKRSFQPQVTPDESRWTQGLAAWDILYNDHTGSFIDNVNLWLSDQTRLSTNYQLERVSVKEVPIPSAMHSMFERRLNEDDLGELQEIYETLETRVEIALRNFEMGILVAPSDVGVGISQMIPVIVAALRKQGGILAIEQPELHVHPAIQVGMGDLFIQAITHDPNSLSADKSLLIETHSEHIMLRLLRRIQENTHNELPPGVVGLCADKLSIIYVEYGDSGVRFHPLRVDDEGDFCDRWPHGFFEERARELF